MKIIDVLTILILGVIILLVIKPLLKRICTRQTCCGEERIKIKKKKLHKPIGSYKLSVEGMQCMNCAKRITDAVNKLEGLSCKVSLEKKEIFIQYEDKPKKIEVIKLLGDMDFLAREK